MQQRTEIITAHNDHRHRHRHRRDPRDDHRRHDRRHHGRGIRYYKMLAFHAQLLQLTVSTHDLFLRMRM